MHTSRRLALGVGAFVLVGVVLALVVVMMLAREQMWFKKRYTLRATFPDVGGLQEGATVRLGGRVVGIVTNIAFNRGSTNRNEALVVTMRIRREYADLVRTDTKATIASQGLLGDKLVELSLGSPDAPVLAEGTWLVGADPADPSRLIAMATEAAEHARNVLARLDTASEGLGDEGTTANLKATLASLDRITSQIEHGPGTAHELIYGDELVVEMHRAAAGFGRVAGAAERILTVIRLDSDAPDLLVNMSRAGKSVAGVADSVDTKRLNRASADLADIIAHVKSGRGTLGGLIMDPTLYEETKRVLVNIRRNRILKMAARFVISKSDAEDLMDGKPQSIEIRPRRAPVDRVNAGKKGRTRKQ